MSNGRPPPPPTPPPARDVVDKQTRTSRVSRASLAQTELTAVPPPPSHPAIRAQIEVELTPEGLRNRFKVLTALFSYLDLIRKQGVPAYLAPELQALSDLGWRFQDKREPGSLVSTLVATMQDYSPEMALR